MPPTTSLSITGFDVGAINDTTFDVDALTVIRVGKRVHRAGAALPQTAASAIFTVSGGLVAAVIVGRVTTVIQTQANNTKLVANPTSGSDVDLCAVLNISADAVGDIYAMTGTLSDALVGAGVACAMQAKPVIVPAGTIDLNCAASNTGAIEWWCYYVPLEDGATVTAA